MHKVLLDLNKYYALWSIIDVLALDENGNFKTSYPEHEIDIFDKVYLDDDKIIVKYYYKQPVLSN